MTKYILTGVFIVLSFGVKAQEIFQYKASNGITYKIRDTIRLGKGSGQDGWFVYMLPSGFNTSNTQREWMKRKFTNGGVFLKEINVRETRGVKSYEFIVGGGALYNFHLSIEEAISTCEVVPCNKSNG